MLGDLLQFRRYDPELCSRCGVFLGRPEDNVTVEHVIYYRDNRLPLIVCLSCDDTIVVGEYLEKLRM